MVSLGTLTLLAALAAPPSAQPVLLDFSATWCAPCRTMEPTIARLKRDGYQVRPVDIEREPELASRYGVRQIPCFVMVADGRETDRVVGPTSYARLQQMFLAAQPPAGVKVLEETDHRDRDLGATPVQRALAATVRLTVEDPQTISYGTGTIIDTHGDEALVLTCGHIFRESQGKARVRVDIFAADGQPVTVDGRLLEYDLKRDVAFLTIRPGRPVTAVKVADATCQPRVKDRVFSIGCDRGVQPRVEESHISALDRFLGPRNIEVAGQPVTGRSGGGLFASDGRLIGVCNARDKEYNEGMYAALSEIQNMLTTMGLAEVFEKSNPPLLADNPAPPRPVPPRQAAPRGGAVPFPEMRSAEPSPSTGRLTREEHALVEALQRHGDNAEVLCIVRSRNEPPSRSELIVLQNPSPNFLSQLSREFVNQRYSSRQTTSQEFSKSGQPYPPASAGWHVRGNTN